MERTISGMVGKGSVNHNTRAFTAKMWIVIEVVLMFIFVMKI